MPPAEQLFLALGVALALCALVVLHAVRKWWRSFRARRRGRHAHSREADARTLLERAGFTVEETQVRRTWSVRCDGAAHPIDLRADYLVERAGERYVADVKTGERATKITTAATRRQLLEYRVAYDVTGVLLVDMDAERIREVTFDLAPSR